MLMSIQTRDVRFRVMGIICVRQPNEDSFRAPTATMAGTGEKNDKDMGFSEQQEVLGVQGKAELKRRRGVARTWDGHIVEQDLQIPR